MKRRTVEFTHDGKRVLATTCAWWGATHVLIDTANRYWVVRFEGEPEKLCVLYGPTSVGGAIRALLYRHGRAPNPSNIKNPELLAIGRTITRV